MVSRATRTPFAAWWWTIDRLCLAAVITVMLGGIVLSLAASPPVAARIGLDPFYFVNRHIMYLVPAIAVMVGVSFLSPRQMRRLALIMFALSFALVVATLVFRRRGEGRAALARYRRRQHPAVGISQTFVRDPDRLAVRGIRAQAGRAGEHNRAVAPDRDHRRARAAAGFRPDDADRAGVGRAVLHGRDADGVGGGSRAALRQSGLSLPIRRSRTSRGASNASSIRRRATRSRSIPRSNLLCAAAGSASGPGEGTVKRILPDSHADFVFAVAAEEFGIVLCLVIVALFAFIVLRALANAMRNEDPFTPVRDCRAGDPVRHPIGGQHGGQSGAYSGKRHDTAVYFLRWVVDDFARLWHGHVAGVDARRGQAPNNSRPCTISRVAGHAA